MADAGKAPTKKALTVMPASIDVVDFAKARSEEIRMLKKDIEDAKYRGARRVFQTLPRAMRRRAASHNIKRLPTRLRNKAIEEMLKDPGSIKKERKKPPCRRRRRRTKDIQLMATKRQKDKRWLETHIWHAKRAKMIDIWGFRLALHPNEKCLKACLRAAWNEDYFSTPFLHDASYLVTFQLSGPLPTLLARLGEFLPEDFDEDPSLMSFQGETEISSASGRLICPAKYVIRKTEGKMAVAWVFVHPSAKVEASEKLLTRRENDQDDDGHCELVDLTGQLNIFQFAGAGALRLLHDTLCPVEESGITLEQWHRLMFIDRPLELLVEDPRFRFPPKPAHQTSVPRNHLPASSVPLQPLQNTIWDGELRTKCAEMRKSEAQLNELRAKQAIPGTALVPSAEEDPFVPVLILPPSKQTLNTTTLILPKDWGRPFWRSFIFAKVRFGGLEQVAKYEQECLTPAFPYDFPGTTAYEAWMAKHSQELEAAHLAKPPAKRVNYEKMKVPSPFKPAFPQNSWIMSSSILSTFRYIISKYPTEDLAVLWSGFLPQLPMEGALLQGSLICLEKGSPEFNATITASHDSDDPIGYVTTGFYSIRVAKGAAIASCNAFEILKILLEQPENELLKFTVWVRNTNSFTKRAAIFTLV